MIRIEFDGVTNADKPLLKALSAALLQCANGEYGALMGTDAGIAETVIAAHTHTGSIRGDKTIAPEDNPEAGTDATEVFDPNAAIVDSNGNLPDPQTVFADPKAVFATGLPNGTDGIYGDTGNGVPLAPVPGNVAGVAPVPGNVAGVAPNVLSPNGVTPQTTATAVNAPELDKNGLPWDARIHASSKGKVQAGTWKYKRGVDDATIKAIEDELRAVMGNVGIVDSPVAPVPVSPIAVVPALVAPSVPNVIPAPPPSIVEQPAVSPVPAPPVPPVPPQIDGQQQPLTFATFLPKVTGALAAGTLTQEALAVALAKYQITTLPSLVHCQHIIPTLAAELGIV